MYKCDFCSGYINGRCIVGDQKRAENCKIAEERKRSLVGKDGKVIKVLRLTTQINGADKLNDVEIYLNRIGQENIMHISTIGEDMLVVYRSEVNK